MALNSSGPISLGGTTAGQSIELELGGTGTTAISLNDTTVRTLAGVSSGAITMPTDFWGRSSVSSYIIYIDSTVSSGGITTAYKKVGGYKSGNFVVNVSAQVDGGVTSYRFLSFNASSGTQTWYGQYDIPYNTYSLNFDYDVSTDTMVFSGNTFLGTRDAIYSCAVSSASTSSNSGSALYSQLFSPTNQNYYYNAMVYRYGKWYQVGKAQYFVCCCGYITRSSWRVSTDQSQSGSIYSGGAYRSRYGDDYTYFSYPSPDAANDGSFYFITDTTRLGRVDSSGALTYANAYITSPDTSFYQEYNGSVSPSPAETSSYIITPCYHSGSVYSPGYVKTVASSGAFVHSVGVNLGSQVLGAYVEYGPDGYYYLISLSYLTTGLYFVSKFDTSGNPIWHRRLQWTGSLSGWSPIMSRLAIKFDGLGYYYFMIDVPTSGTSTKNFVVKLPTDGSSTNSGITVTGWGGTFTYSVVTTASTIISSGTASNSPFNSYISSNSSGTTITATKTPVTASSYVTSL
jgi:hypothetical protein